MTKGDSNRVSHRFRGFAGNHSTHGTPDMYSALARASISMYTPSGRRGVAGRGLRSLNAV